MDEQASLLRELRRAYAVRGVAAQGLAPSGEARAQAQIR
jgi:hypothetical protein